MKQLLHVLLSPESSQPLICFLTLWIFHLNGHILCGLGDWLLPLKRSVFKVHQCCSTQQYFVPFNDGFTLQIYLLHIHSSIHGHLGSDFSKFSGSHRSHPKAGKAVSDCGFHLYFPIWLFKNYMVNIFLEVICLTTLTLQDMSLYGAYCKRSPNQKTLHFARPHPEAHHSVSNSYSTFTIGSYVFQKGDGHLGQVLCQEDK